MKRSMSELGPSLPVQALRAMSGLPPLASELRTFQIGSSVPTAEVTNLTLSPRRLSRAVRAERQGLASLLPSN
jgi:hypothetical protein